MDKLNKTLSNIMTNNFTDISIDHVMFAINNGINIYMYFKFT